MMHRKKCSAVIRHLSEADLGYMAGILDGEGSICIVRMLRGSPKVSFNVQVSITNTDLVMLDWLTDRLGGSIIAHGRYKGTGKMCFRWYMGGYSALPVLERLKPYLMVKKRQADLAIHFLLLARKWNWEARAVMYEDMKKLNGSQRFPANFSPTARKQVSSEATH